MPTAAMVGRVHRESSWWDNKKQLNALTSMHQLILEPFIVTNKPL